jgi:hypothetical protein
MYSFGSSMEETRFYFADAAAQAAMLTISDSATPGRPADEEVLRLAASVNEALAPLVAAFLESRGLA